MNTLKENILKLRSENKTYQEIANELGCSKANVCYHCDPNQKKYYAIRRSKNRRKGITNIKMSFGGKCSICNYDRCLNSLDFHHLKPKEKTEGVSKLLTLHGIEAARQEAKKCILICRNCHGELHAGLISI